MISEPKTEEAGILVLTFSFGLTSFWHWTKDYKIHVLGSLMHNEEL